MVSPISDFLMEHYWQSTTNSHDHDLVKFSAIFKEDSLQLTLFRNKEAWEATVSLDELKSEAAKCKWDFEEYYNNLKMYIKCRENVQIQFDAPVFKILLLLENDMKMPILKVDMAKTEATENIFRIINMLYAQKTNYFHELSANQEKIKALENECAVLKTKLDKFLDRKKENEQNMFNNFIALLIEKKKQIQHLNDLLTAFRQGRPTVNPPASVKRKTVKHNGKEIKKMKTSEEDLQESATESESNDGPRIENRIHKIKKRNDSPVSEPSRTEDDLFHTSSDEDFDLPKRVQNELASRKLVLRNENCTQEFKEYDSCKVEERNEDNILPDVDFNTQDLLDNL